MPDRHLCVLDAGNADLCCRDPGWDSEHTKIFRGEALSRSTLSSSCHLLTPASLYSHLSTFYRCLQMVAKDVDPETGDAVDDGVPDEYPLEDLDVTISDFVASVGCLAWRGRLIVGERVCVWGGLICAHR